MPSAALLDYSPTMPKARLLLHERVVVDGAAFAEIKIWEVPRPVQGSVHTLKYSLSFIVDGVCILRYDNEAGKGDHRHDAGGKELPYAFRSAGALIEDFWKDVDAWKAGRAGETT